MSEETEKLLFQVTLDIPDLEKKAEAARAAMARLREEKKATDKELRDKTISAEEYAKSMQSIETQLSRTQTQLKGYTKQLADYEKMNKSAKGSSDQLKAQLALLSPTYGSMSKEMRETTDEGKQLTATIKEITDELKKNESQVGSNSRNVGNYSQAIFQAISPNNSLIEKVRGASVALSGFREQTRQQITALKATAEGMSTAEKATFAFGLTLKGLGIGLIIAAVAALVGFLTKMDAGMDRVKQATAAVSAAISTLLQRLAPLGEAMVNALIHPIDSAIALGRALLHPIDSGKKLIDSTLGIADAMSQAARAAIDYTKTIQSIEDAQIGLIGKSAQVKQQVDLAILAAEDQSRSYKERIKLLDDAGKAELALAKQTVSLETQKLTAIIKLNKSRVDSGQKLQRADREAFEQQLAATTNAQTEAYQKEQEIRNRRASLIEQEVAKQKQNAEELKKLQQEAAKEQLALAQRLLIFAKQQGIDTLKLEEDIIRRKAALDSVGLKKNSEQRKLIEAQANADILALNVSHAAELAAKENAIKQAGITSSLALVRQGSKEELALRIEQLQAQGQAEAIETQKRLAGKANEQQREIELGRIAIQTQVAIDAAKQQFAQADIQRQASLASDRLQTEQDLGKDTLSLLRAIASDRIDLEEKTQIQLLDVEKKYGRISDEDYLTRLNTIQAKAIAAHKDLDRQVREDEINNERARAVSRLANSRQGSKEELKARIDAINAEARAALNVANLTAEQRKAINDKANREIADAQKEFFLAQAQSLVSTIGQANQALSALFESQIQRQNQTLEDQRNAQLASAGLSAEARTKIEERFNAKKIQLDREAAEKRRKIQTVENVVQIASGVIAAQKEPFPFNLIKSALVVATGIAQQAVIASQKFARGGIIEGPSHAQGGVKYVVGGRRVELEGGEGVINKRSMAIPGVREQASRLNQLGGGVSFSNLSPGRSYLPQRMALGGILPTSPVISPSIANFDFAKLDRLISQTVIKGVAQAVSSMPQPILNVKDVIRETNKRVSVQNRADS